jgi:hypothetical protein
MQDFLQYIDLDFYRSAQLLIARAEIAQLRRQPSALVRTEQQGKNPTGASSLVPDFDQTAHPAPAIQSTVPGTQFTRSRDLDH